MNPVLRLNLLHVIAIILATSALWVALNRPSATPAWPEHIGGFAYAPLQRGQSPARGDTPIPAQIEADLALLAESTSAIRTYSIDASYGEIPGIAERYGLDVTVGVDLNGDHRRDEARLDRLATITSQSRNVRRAILGNETLLTETLAFDELTALLARAKRMTSVAVSTAEPWHVWLEHPALADHVDFITVHLLPYWEGVALDDAVDYAVSRLELLEQTFPDKPIVIGEVGWPSFGRTRSAAVASSTSAETFLRRFVARATAENYDYFLMEAFDQPWKRYDEGQVGAYWGIFDADRSPKFDFAAPAVSIRGWPILAGFAALFACVAFLAMSADGARLRHTGRGFIAVIATIVATATIWGIAVNFPSYWSWLDVAGATVLMMGLLGVIALILVEAHDWAEALWCRRAEKRVSCNGTRYAAARKVSIHVPTYKEPPELVAQTLRALAELDYPDFEVIVIDNNTKDESLWKPIESLCARLGERFRFFHVDPLAGYKAGALNFALAQTAPDATIIAVIDADYAVRCDWLRDLVPQFDDERVAIVQAPQDYRDAHISAFKSICEAEYRGFFKLGMVTRNDRNAIIQHGTMTMMRKRVLEEVGAWDAHTVTEDAELGLRVLEHGYGARYVATSYGKGLTPDNFLDYKRQRHRWALGAGQTLRKHRAQLVGTAPTALDRGQRYHFVAGWLPWLADGISLLFNAIAIVWSIAMVLAPARFFPPLAAFSGFVVGLFAFKLAKTFVLYRWRVGATVTQTVGAMLAGLSLVYTVGTAIVIGLTGREAPFRRTPKLAARHSLLGALAAAGPEAGLATALLACAASVSATAPFASIDTTLWCWLLTIFAVPHLSAVAVSLLSALPRQLEPIPRKLETLVGESQRG